MYRSTTPEWWNDSLGHSWVCVETPDKSRSQPLSLIGVPESRRTIVVHAPHLWRGRGKGARFVTKLRQVAHQGRLWMGDVQGLDNSVATGAWPRYRAVMRSRAERGSEVGVGDQAWDAREKGWWRRRRSLSRRQVDEHLVEESSERISKPEPRSAGAERRGAGGGGVGGHCRASKHL